MLAISVDNLEEASEVVQMLGIPFPILYDPSTEAPQSYMVFNLLGDGLATPSTFILDKEGVITWKYVGRRIGDRPSVSTILAQLSGLDPTVTLAPTDWRRQPAQYHLTRLRSAPLLLASSCKSCLPTRRR